MRNSIQLNGVLPRTDLQPAANAGRALRFNGLQQVLVNDTSFYNFNTGPFAFLLDAIPWHTVNSIWLSKSTADVNGYGFQLENGRASFAFVMPPPQGSIEVVVLRYTVNYTVQRGERVKILFQRVGTNDAPSTDAANWPASNRNPANYQFYVNGVMQQRVQDSARNTWSELTTSVTDTANPLAFGATADLVAGFTGYLCGVAVWGDALRPGEIQGLQLGDIPARAGRGIWEANSVRGRTFVDSSSVRRDGVLPASCYPDTTVGIPTAATNQVWVPEAGILVMPNVSSSLDFTAPFALTVYRVGCAFAAASVSYQRLDAVGEPTGPNVSLVFTDTEQPDANIYAKAARDLNIALVAGEKLRFYCSGGAILEVLF